ncbi:MAG: lamin tail domain-containing protein [Candidatus Krumholzibacteria bacterium]|nr:lamin tail domain-containing protein [Candidatus Krumholzibacteria bacterium]
MTRSFSILVFNLFTACASLFSPVLAFEGPVINEVYYDEPGPDIGREFIEIINAGSVAVDLSGYLIYMVDGRTGRRDIIWVAKEGLVIPPGGILAIKGSYYDPVDGLSLDGHLQNGPDAVMLFDGDAVIDIAGYGDLEDQGLYESSPCIDVGPGWSLARRPDGYDSDSNYSDFVPAKPSPGVRNFFDYDLSVLIERESLLYCFGSPASIPVELFNAGLRSFAGTLRLFIESGEDLSVSEIFCELVPGASFRTQLTLWKPEIFPERTAVIVDASTDENHGNDTAFVNISLSPADIVINEIMARPSDGCCEWIEIFNRGTYPVDIGCWSISDRSGSRGIVQDDIHVIESGAFMVLTRDSDLLSECHESVGEDIRIQVDGWPSLNDRDTGGIADVVSLTDRSGILVDEVDYSDMWGEERGRSIERYSPDACSAGGRLLWHRSLSPDGATPGCLNSTVSSDDIPAGMLSITPQCLDYGTSVGVSISIAGYTGEYGCSITMYDMEGVAVKRLVAERKGALVLTCRWDGMSDRGLRLPTGLYICVAEFLGEGGRVCRRVKECFAVRDGT